jgi:FAD-linked sulfhydryl oxidase
MANRQITRRVLLSAVVLVCIIFVLFIRPQGPPSPAIRAPGHIEKPGLHTAAREEMLKGETVMPRLGNETVK